MKYELEPLIERFKNKDKIALAKLITILENDPKSASEIFSYFEEVKNDAYIVGITGSPGVGKSTLTGAIAQKLLDSGKKIGVIC
ncbi:MAG: methylmalonyl Co-A mutase-associated GTPase MeaB, partial [Promethearchaeota archaeon]